LAYKIFSKFPFELKKVAPNSINAARSIPRNISEGYCRSRLKEYINHQNIDLGSCGEFHSCYESFKQANQITMEVGLNMAEIELEVLSGRYLNR
jgi:four helix bundle protein